MLIENLMYFALGLLVASLAALVLLPAVWKRAVRLTRRRIEAATPITLAEFRADKDQLRAEFAVTTRRLEMHVETLRKRLAEQLAEANQRRTDMGAMRAEREKHRQVVEEYERQVDEQRTRLLDLDKHVAELALQVREADRAREDRDAEIATLRQALRDGLPEETALEVARTGDREEDFERLSTALAIERKRAAFLEEQAQALVLRLESSDRRGETKAAIADMRAALDHEKRHLTGPNSLGAAEARIASAETRLNAILGKETEEQVAGEATGKRHLADQLTLDEALAALQRQVGAVERTILSDWTTERFDADALRDQLSRIAGGVSRIVYAGDREAGAPEVEESLFDRVQRFADDGETEDMLTVTPAVRSGAVSDRLVALREIQSR
jgi:chromosome segregation ATPase